MVTSQHCGNLLALVFCSALLSLPSDGATVYGLPRQLDYDTHLQDPVQEGAAMWDGTGAREGGNSIFSSNSVPSDSISSSSTSIRDLGRPPQSYIPGRYTLLSPEESFLRELLLHSAAPNTRPITGQKFGDVTSLAFPEELDRMELRLPSLDLARLNVWAQQQQQHHQLYSKPKRVSPPEQLHQKQRSLSVVGLKVAEKKWWGGGHHRRGEIARRASQNKHLDCLKSCIKQGTLHPIQCHTLC
ncbi:uncharacterized protein [Procambarus clarkii]|uniref:uncharacterized protein n=1 Tax=Procambarus clarkii TaxID=6728 RepID=UPI001E671285|nr:uncharacterized protein LOC123769785 [Procambarus clarkii]